MHKISSDNFKIVVRKIKDSIQIEYGDLKIQTSHIHELVSAYLGFKSKIALIAYYGEYITASLLFISPQYIFSKDLLRARIIELSNTPLHTIPFYNLMDLIHNSLTLEHIMNQSIGVLSFTPRQSLDFALSLKRNPAAYDDLVTKLDRELLVFFKENNIVFNTEKYGDFSLKKVFNIPDGSQICIPISYFKSISKDVAIYNLTALYARDFKNFINSSKY